jgi:hypothetical protein
VYYSYDPMRGLVPVDAPVVKGVVVSDARFINEFAALKNAGGAVIRLVRPETDSVASQVGIANHVSETEQLTFTEYDFILNNHGSLAQLFDSVDIYMSIFEAQHKG